MENPVPTTENILHHLRQNRLKNKELEVYKLLENIEKQECEGKSEQHKNLDDILQVFARTNTCNNADDVFGCVIWLTNLQERQKLPFFSESQLKNIVEWLLDQHQTNENNKDVVCRILLTFGNLFALHPGNSGEYVELILKVNLKYIACNESNDILVSAIQCMDKIFKSLKDDVLSDELFMLSLEAGYKLVQLYYDDSNLNFSNFSASFLLLYTLQILHKIVTLNGNLAHIKLAELMGISKAYLHYGVEAEGTSSSRPQKVYKSQQAAYDLGEESDNSLENMRSYGGKIPKARKPRAVVKNARPNDSKKYNRSPEIRSGPLVYDMRVSDSDVSEPENASNRILFERNRKAKVRLASINLIGIITRNIDRKSIFGYWHFLLPNGTGDSKDNLLYIGQHDPNIRCRSAALQICSHLLYGSKGCLQHAKIEMSREHWTTFIPFSVNLGYTVLAIYNSITTILSSESSLPVLTQALKCLAVLVQATPFQHCEKGFVQQFVKDVKPLIYHRDAAIQVSALMVMEFLVALPESTCDIAEAIGLPPEAATRSKCKPLHIGDEDVDIVDIEEYVESDEDICESSNTDETTNKNCNIACGTENTSWLLNRVLYNLSKQNKVFATSVRIESLQVLIAMTPHFAIIKPQLSGVSDVLQYSLEDPLPDVRLYAARCIDACAYQISRYLLDNVSCVEAEIQEYHIFWLKMLPKIVGHIGRESEKMTTVRITLCDALSNIGVIMFEHTSHSSQISLLSFLSGVSSDSSEETIVRAAAVRALAVFALYPSLRRDLVFIENSADLTIRLVKDSNLSVRVKSFWSLGNISDALIGKGSEVPHNRQERISDDTLFRLIDAATIACNDNDKVRCNAVRTLGNLLRLLTDEHLKTNTKLDWRIAFTKSISKLSDCIRSSGNAKVKWNTCYAISNLLKNQTFFKIDDLNWRETLFSALCHVIVNHSNFKVRINASTAIMNLTERSQFGIYYEKFFLSILQAIEQSDKLENFQEYNHRDGLQEQLCLTLSHIIVLASNDDLPMLKKYLLYHEDDLRFIRRRVINRMVPEKTAAFISCSFVLLKRAKDSKALTLEQKNALNYLIDIFKC